MSAGVSKSGGATNRSSPAVMLNHVASAPVSDQVIVSASGSVAVKVANAAVSCLREPQPVGAAQRRRLVHFDDGDGHRADVLAVMAHQQLHRFCVVVDIVGHCSQLKCHRVGTGCEDQPIGRHQLLALAYRPAQNHHQQQHCR